MPHPTLRHPLPATPRLTQQEIRALAALGAGMTFDSAARQLGVSGRTIRRLVRNACDRIGVDTTIEAVTWAAKRDLI